MEENMTYNKINDKDIKVFNYEYEKPNDIDMVFNAMKVEYKENKNKDEIDISEICNFLNKSLLSLGHFIEMESHKPTILYFIVGSLKLLNKFDESLVDKCLNLILSCAIITKNKLIGFRGGNFTGYSETQKHSSEDSKKNDVPHLASTYSSLAVLHMLKIPLLSLYFKEKLLLYYNLKKVEINIIDIINSLKETFNSMTGCFSAMNLETKSEEDARFIYCFFAIREF